MTEPAPVPSSPLAPQPPGLSVGPAPHVRSSDLTTRGMMFDVLLASIPLLAVAWWVFRTQALLLVGIAVISALAAEALFNVFRRRRSTLDDLSAAVTGLILGLSIPPGAPWYVAAIGAFAGIGFGKAVFGGLGQNIFNPAMVGRAFVMVAFPAAFGAAAYVAKGLPDAVTQATPLTALKMSGAVTPLGELFTGMTAGSIGETSALASLMGGLYLCLRGTAAWRIPAGAILTMALLGGMASLGRSSEWTVLHHLCAGAFLFGAFFIATDPVSSPLTARGQWWFGAGYATFVLLIRWFGGYPEGVMFSILLMNALTPLINRWTVPVPVGGPAPQRK